MKPLRAQRSSTKLTPAGRILLPVAAASLIASWAAGGLLGLFAATACALLLVAPILTALHLRGLRVAPPGPLQVQVGDPFTLEPVVTNASTRLHARHVTLACGAGDTLDARPAGHLLALSSGGSRRVPVVHRLHSRGRHRRLDLVLSSSFPFGLVRRRLHFVLPVELLALPRLGSLNDLGRLPSGQRRLVQDHRQLDRGEEEFYGVRDWREGESLRRVHWRISARRDRRIVREFRHRAEPPVHVVLATRVEDKLPVGTPRRLFERSVSLAATVAEHFLRRGCSVRLTLAGEETRRIEPARGRAGLLRILTALAEVRATDGEPEPALEPVVSRARAAGELPIAVLAGAAARPPGDRVILDVEDRGLDRVFLPGRPWGMRAPFALGGLR